MDRSFLFSGDVIRLHLAAGGLGLLASMPAFGQFSTILNIPPDPDLSGSRLVTSDTQVNLSDNGFIGSGVQFGRVDGSSTNIELNVTGGEMDLVTLREGTRTSISGGNHGYVTLDGANLVDFSGGRIEHLMIDSGTTTFNISGGRIDEIDFSGALKLNTDADITMSDGEVTTTGGIGFSLSQGIFGTGSFTQTGGRFTSQFRQSAARDVSLTGGEFNGSINTVGGTGVLDGAVITRVIGVSEGGTLDIRSGSVGSSIGAGTGATLNLHTNVGAHTAAVGDGATFNFLGADHTYQTFIISAFTSDPHTNTINAGTGTLAFNQVSFQGSGRNGTTIFNFDGADLTHGDVLINSTKKTILNLSAGSLVGLASATQTAFDASEINMTGGSIGDGYHFNEGDQSLGGYNLLGGTIGQDAAFQGAFSFFKPVQIGGTTLGNNALFELRAEITAGGVGTGAHFKNDLTLAGGQIGNNATIEDTFNFFSEPSFIMTGGSLGNDASVRTDTEVAGGMIGDRFTFDGSGKELVLLGSQFFLDGVEITNGMSDGDSLIITDREVLLNGTLRDGSAFDFFLSEQAGNIGLTDYFDPTSTIRISLILPAFITGDMDGDDQFNNADIAPFVAALTNPAEYATMYPGLDPDERGDFTGDGALTNADIAGFVDALVGGGSLTQAQGASLAQSLAAVPEPSSAVLLGLGGLVLARRRQRRST